MIEIEFNITPIDDMVLILPDPSTAMTDGGIIIPESQQIPTSTGQVISTGRGIHTQMGELVKLNCQPGDKVMFNPLSGVDVKIKGVIHKMMRDHDVMAKVIKGSNKDVLN